MAKSSILLANYTISAKLWVQFLAYFHIFRRCFFRCIFNVIFGSILGCGSVVHFEPKIAQNARKARIGPGTPPGSILEPFWVPFLGHFRCFLESLWQRLGQFSQIHPEYMQIRADTRKLHANMRKYRRSEMKIA